MLGQVESGRLVGCSLMGYVNTSLCDSCWWTSASLQSPARPSLSGWPGACGPCVGVGIGRIVRVVGLQKDMSDFRKVESERSLMDKELQ